MTGYDYVVCVNRYGRKGQRCRILTSKSATELARAGMNQIQVQFEDGEIVLLDRAKLRLKKKLAPLRAEEA